MNNWSEDRDKVLCGCGAVSWTYTKFTEGRYLLKEACPGCDKTDDVMEICSIQKMSHKKAERIIETLCELLESNPMGIIGGGLGRQVESLAQHLEDVNRVTAAERVRKAWKMVLDGMMKGAQGLFPGMNAQKSDKPKEFLLVSGPPPEDIGRPAITMLPGCSKCRKPVLDYKKEWRWQLDGFFCLECRSSIDKDTKIKLSQEQISKTARVASEMLEGVATMNKQLEALLVQE
jgi:hypothetical protein